MHSSMATKRKKAAPATSAASSSSKQKKRASPPPPPPPASHKPTYLDMIKEAISNSEDKHGLSRQGIKAFMREVYDVDPEAANTKVAFKKALDKGIDSGELVLPNGTSGKIKLAAKSSQKKKKAEEPEDEDESEQENHKPPAKKAKTKSSTSASSSSSKPAAKGRVQQAAKKRIS
ncbi:unnamed protein product [Tilletia controversa]|nr:hypothetical protein CF335_g560 [Tilletia laevis]CAD6963322.1 unnamed protein product [Tilletia controversa]CAD7063584.1 unnamed protein product [Tilletia caries]